MDAETQLELTREALEGVKCIVLGLLNGWYLGQDGPLCVQTRRAAFAAVERTCAALERAGREDGEEQG